MKPQGVLDDRWGQPRGESMIMERQLTEMRNRFTGCLLGGAAGDALGAPVEFMSRRQILARFGPAGITEYAPAYGGLGRITDDTQMMLFTAEGLLRGLVRGAMRGMVSRISVVASAYERWLFTQGSHAAKGSDDDWLNSGWLVKQQALHSRRAPGNTCLSALRHMASFGDMATNNSKGCGGVMRVAPVGLFFWPARDGATAFDLGVEAAAITHGHPSGHLTGGVLAAMILYLLHGDSLLDALEKARTLLVEHDGHEEILNALNLAEVLASERGEASKAIAQLGQGWVAEEALAIAIYCALVAKDFRYGVTLAVNHDGDSDSTGAITGNLLGAMWGVEAIPTSWLEPLELREVINEVAEDLLDCNQWDVDDYGGRDNDWVWEKYPGY